MCGICGIIKARGRQPDEDLLRRMVKKLHHRGPDGSGIYIDGEVGLGHTRLAVNDLSDRGTQPMRYMNRYMITFDGNIYNHLTLRAELEEKGYLFSSDTGTEVVMAAYDAWGTDCLSRFNGTWAFALYDSEKKDTFFARDRLGVKPLYYTSADGDFIFASEIKSILGDERVTREINLDIAYDFLTQGLVDHTDETFFCGIHKLPQGSFLYMRHDGEITLSRYYTPVFNEEAQGELHAEQIERFSELFQDSLRLRLCANVPVGSCLSGGLDSSAIVCGMPNILRDEKTNVDQHTFSMCPEDPRLSERRYMDDVLRYTGANGHFVTPTAEELLGDLNTLLYHQEEPFASTSIYASFRVMRLARECGISVLLDGQGADEILCGYRKSRLYYVQRLIKEHAYVKAVWESVNSASQMRTSFQKRNDFMKARRILGKKSDSGASEAYLCKGLHGHGHDYDRRENFQYNDVMRVSLPALLRYADKNGMAHSVEGRLPFLDYRLVDFAAALPLETKIKNGYSKYIMRKALDMPKSVRRRKDKIGYATPEQLWLRQGKEVLQERFKQAAPAVNGVLDTRGILRDWSELEHKNANQLWRFIILALWMKEFEVV